MSTAAPRSASDQPIVVMGVSGCGKSSVGERLAEALGLPYVEGDALHPAANVAKMAQGLPLTDADRWPWLDAVGAALAQGGVVSCSALKVAYRDHLRRLAGGRLAFVYLHGSQSVLEARMTTRAGHFMPVSLLASQLATLEVPTGEAGVVTVTIDQPLDGIVAEALAGLRNLG